MSLNALETFEEGEFTLANKLRFRRYYVTNTTYTDGMYTYLTEVVDSTAVKYKGSIAMVHGAAQCHDVFFETAIQFALNGFCVHLVDLEGHGFTGGNRINKLSIEKFHHQVVTLLEQARPDIPLFLFGHSMGGLTVASFLGRNQQIAEKLAGVIYSAPYFGPHETLGVDFAKRAMTSVLSGVLDEFALVAPLALHKVCRSKSYVRCIITGRKAAPLMSLQCVASGFKNQDRVLMHASNVTYPYQVCVAEKDSIVCNKAIREWHDKTSSQIKEMKMIRGAYHELSKEPNNHDFFEYMLKFMAARLKPGVGCARNFGSFSSNQVRFATQKPVYKKRRFWVLLTLFYLLIGLLIAVLRR